jgi:hypothetical protein
MSAPVGGGSPVGSIIPASGINATAKILFVTSKLYSRQLISLEEKRILKQLAIRVSTSESRRGGASECDALRTESSHASHLH